MLEIIGYSFLVYVFLAAVYMLGVYGVADRLPWPLVLRIDVDTLRKLGIGDFKRWRNVSGKGRKQ